MEYQDILEELLALLEQNGITIRTEPMGGAGAGLCKLKDKQVFFVDSDASAADLAAICAQAVLGTVDIDNIYLKPRVRDFLEGQRPEKLPFDTDSPTN